MRKSRSCRPATRARYEMRFLHEFQHARDLIVKKTMGISVCAVPNETRRQEENKTRDMHEDTRASHGVRGSKQHVDVNHNELVKLSGIDNKVNQRKNMQE